MSAPNSKKAIRAKRLIEAAKQSALVSNNKMFGEMYVHAVTESTKGNTAFLTFIKNLSEVPVDIDTFLDSPEFMGATDLKLWPSVRETIINVCSPWWRGDANGAYREVLLTGGTGTGKCLTKLTEYLSSDGWRRIDEYDGGKVAQVNPDGSMEMVTPLAYIDQPNTTGFLRVSNTTFSFEATPNHRVPSFSEKTGKMSVNTLAEIADTHERNARGFRGRIPATFKTRGKQGLWLTDDQIRLMVAVMADGHFPRRKGHSERYCILHVKKEKKKKRLSVLLDACGIAYNRYDSADGYSTIAFLAPERNKTYEGWWVANQNQLQVIRDEVLFWDGARGKCDRFFTCDRHTADFIQYVGAATGSKTSINVYDRVGGMRGGYERKSIEYTVIFQKGDTHSICKGSGDKPEFTRITDDREYCFTVPSGLFLIRQEGHISVTGNSEICKVVTAYFLHILGCLKSPQIIYDLPSATSIVIPIQAAKPHVTKKVIYMPLRSYIEAMPWFQRNMRPDKLIEAEMYFVEKNVRVVQGGADSDAILGDAVIGAVVDEINFMHVVQKSKRADVASGGRSGSYDQAQSVYEALIRRKKSRFITRGPQIGIICVSSSRRYKNDFTDRRQKQVEDNEERGVYVYDKTQYEARPASGYCGETFRLAVFNNAAMDIRILEETDNDPRGAEVFHVPVEYYDEFVKSPAGSVRDILGRSINSISPFIKKRTSILEAVKRGEEKGLDSIVVKDNVILGIEGMPAVKRGVYCQNPSKPRYVHIDLSVNGDKCVAEGSPVLMSDGSYRPIETVSSGDRVVSADGRKNLVTRCLHNGTKRVKEVCVVGWFESYRYTGNHRMLSLPRSSISYRDGRLIKPNHGMFSRRNSRAARERYSYIPEYRELDVLAAGDFLATPRPIIEQEHSYKGVELTEDIGYLVGVFAAEGSFYLHRGAEYVQFSLHKDEWAIEDRLRRVLLKTFGVACMAHTQTGTQGMTIRTTKSEFLSWFLYEMCGEYSQNKRVRCLTTGNRGFHKGMLHGLMDGDGYITSTEASLKTTSKSLATDTYWCLAAYGFLPWVYREEAHTPERDGVPRKTAYKVSISGKDQVAMFREFREGIANPPCSRLVGTKDYILSPILSVENAGESAVYDLTVDSSSSYIVGNTGIHNCGIGMVRFDGMVDKQRKTGEIEKLPKATVELAIGIQPDHGAEIDLAEIRAWVKQLKDIYGYPIKAVSYDGYASIESRQQWKKVGMKTGLVSLDRSSVPYKNLRDAFYDGRIDMYKQTELIDELFSLEYDGKVGKDGKVDHPPSSSKDIADGVCGAYQTLLTRASTWIAGFEDDRYDSHMDRRADVSEMERYGEERQD